MLLLTFVLFSLNLISQSKSNVTTEIYTSACPTKPTDTLNISKKIFIKGRVAESGNYENYIPFSTIFIKGTRVYASADSHGYYSLDVTSIADTATIMIVACTYINHKTKEILIENKLLQTTIINFELKSFPNCEMPEIEIKEKPKKKATTIGK